jgi:hypothetical protein
VESGKAEAAKFESDLFYNAFKASPIGIALEDMEGRPHFRGSSPLLDAWTQRRGNAQQTLCRIFFPEKDWSLSSSCERAQLITTR